MANLEIKAGDGSTKYLSKTGAGTDLDPFVDDPVLGEGTATIGKLGENSGVDIGDVDILSIAAGDNNIGNVDIASIAAGDNNIGNVDIASIASGSSIIGATYDAGATWTQVFGVSGIAFTSADASTAAAVTDAPSGGEKLVIDDIIFSADTEMQVDFELETSGAVFFSCFIPANTLYQITPRGKFKLPTADKKLMVDTSVAGNISVLVFYHSEA
jgi:hypothetical protein